MATPNLTSEAEAFLRYVIEHLNSIDAVLRHEETLAYGYWLAKLIEADGLLEAWEYKATRQNSCRE